MPHLSGSSVAGRRRVSRVCCTRVAPAGRAGLLGPSGPPPLVLVGRKALAVGVALWGPTPSMCHGAIGNSAFVISLLTANATHLEAPSVFPARFFVAACPRACGLAKHAAMVSYLLQEVGRWVFLSKAAGRRFVSSFHGVGDQRQGTGSNGS